MIGTITQDMEGKKSSHINNPAICYFQKILVNTSFRRGDNGSVIMKELFFIDCVFKPSQINSATFMLSHLKTIAKARWGNIFIGGLITSIALSMGLDAEVTTLMFVVGSTALGIVSFPAQMIIKTKSLGQYYLLIQHAVIKSNVFPNPRCTDVRVMANYIFDTYDNDDEEATDLPAGGGGDTDVEMGIIF